jgi:hypothetical protein
MSSLKVSDASRYRSRIGRAGGAAKSSHCKPVVGRSRFVCPPLLLDRAEEGNGSALGGDVSAEGSEFRVSLSRVGEQTSGDALLGLGADLGTEGGAHHESPG